MPCSQCELLETIRYDRIKQYCRLFEERKRSRSKRSELTRKIEVIEKELNQAWRQLDLHRRSHATESAQASTSQRKLN
jgi:HPt (histidine-containing phosphotransfer) domain-containing protein